MNRIFVMGDIHGSSDVFTYRWWYNFPDADETDSIICVGDVGISYGGRTWFDIKDAMSDFPGTVYVMRGNHDTRYWRDNVSIQRTSGSQVLTPNKGWRFKGENVHPHLLYEENFPNIKYIRDEGDILTIGNNRILFIPGAYSVDKPYRIIEKLPYEPEEQLSTKEFLQLYSAIEGHLIYNKIDYVVSHTSPLFLEPYYKDLFLDFISQNEVDKTMEQYLDKIYFLLDNKFKHWYFGHFHDDRDIQDKFTMLYAQVVELGENIGS